ncbi:MAG: hypothetical protein ABUL64_01930, partial [Singulisphaera sp.]
MRNTIWRFLAPLVISANLTLAARAADDDEDEVDWDPARTHVFCVGLLQWQREDLWASFPDCMVDRRDEQLVERFRAAGVPDDQITYLQDAQATKEAIQKAFRETLDAAEEGDLLIFYFCGHG